MLYTEFARRLKTKYPEYKDMDDMDLTNRVIGKYPEYKDTVEFDVQVRNNMGDVFNSPEDFDSRFTDIFQAEAALKEEKEKLLGGIKEMLDVPGRISESAFQVLGEPVRGAREGLPHRFPDMVRDTKAAEFLTKKFPQLVTNKEQASGLVTEIARGYAGIDKLIRSGNLDEAKAEVEKIPSPVLQVAIALMPLYGLAGKGLTAGADKVARLLKARAARTNFAKLKLYTPPQLPPPKTLPGQIGTKPAPIPPVTRPPIVKPFEKRVTPLLKADATTQELEDYFDSRDQFEAQREKELRGIEKGAEKGDIVSRVADHPDIGVIHASPEYRASGEYKAIPEKVRRKVFSTIRGAPPDQAAKRLGMDLKDLEQDLQMAARLTPAAGGMKHDTNLVEGLEAKGKTLGDIRPSVRMKADLSIRDIATQEVVTLKKGHEFHTVELEKDGKPTHQFLMQDGKQVVVDKSTFERVKRENLELTGKPWGEPEGVKEIVKGDKGKLTQEQQARYVELKQLIRTEVVGYAEEEELAELVKLRDVKADTKFSKWQVPGGKNYREILLQKGDTKPLSEMTAEEKYDIGSAERRMNELEFDLQSHPAYSESVKVELRAEYKRLADEIRGKQFVSGHWEEPNVIAHARVNDRTIVSPKADQFNEDYQNWIDSGKKGKAPDQKDYGKDEKVLFIEEIQSDWASAGRKKGIKGKETQAKIETLKSEKLALEQEIDGITKATGEEFALRAEWDRVNDEITKLEGSVPFSSHLKNWQELTLKRVLKEAVEKGYNRISWTTGQQQADRYDLSKQIERITYNRTTQEGYAKPGESYIAAHQTGRVEPVVKGYYTRQKAEDTFGKEISKKIFEGEGFYGTLKGQDLKVGGEWAFNLYDRQIPNTLKDLTKKWGGKIDTIQMDTGRVYLNPAQWEGSKKLTQQSLKITSLMREMVLTGGQPKAGGMIHGKKISVEERARDLVESRNTEEIQNKLQKIFGNYEDLEKMQDGEIPMTKMGELAFDYMADLEHAVVQRDTPEVEQILKILDQGGIREKMREGMHSALGEKGALSSIPPRYTRTVEQRKKEQGVSEKKEQYKVESGELFAKDIQLPPPYKGRGGITSPEGIDPRAWEDKWAASLSRETFERNVEKVTGSDAEKITKEIVDPIRKNESQRTNLTNQIIQDVRKTIVEKLKITRNSKEDKLIQEYGEGRIVFDDLKKATEKWIEVTKAEKYTRGLYDFLIDKWNNKRIEFGYKPVPKRKDYFRHFLEIDNIAKVFGHILDSEKLPTELSGLTRLFTPGKPFSTAELKRLGGRYTPSALGGLDNYLETVPKQIFHIDSVQRVRALESYLRKTDEALRKHGQQLNIPNFIANIHEYGNLLAGKKSTADRAIESLFGRQLYGIANFLVRRTGANMIAGNISSALTNFIPFTQFMATSRKRSVLAGMFKAMVHSFQKDPNKVDGMLSDFLLRRFPENEIDPTFWQSAEKFAGKLFFAIDKFASYSIINGKYYEYKKLGLDQKEALRKAGEYAGKVMADRSFGQLPNLMNVRFARILTQFQTEINNVYSFLKHDIPKMSDGNRKKVVSALAQFAIYSYLFNNTYEKVTGRRPTLDIIYAMLTVLGLNEAGKSRKIGKRLWYTAKDISGNLPFIGSIFGGRFPVQAGIPSVPKLLQGKTTLGKEAIRPLAYLVPPFGGGQAKKTIEGLSSFARGYSMTPAGRVRFPINQDVANFFKSIMFGQYSTPQGKEYFEKNRRPLGSGQSRAYEKSKSLKLYDTIMERRRNKRR